MAAFPSRLAVAVAAVPVLIAAFAGPAGAGPDPGPVPGPRLALPEGPWPPGEILAADPDSVTGPATTAIAAAAGSTSCPAPPAGVQHSAPGAGRTVALTFDDGPGRTTQAILTILQRYGVAATFFNLGVNSTARPTLVRSEVVAGHLVGNHTWSHPRLPTLTATGQATELDRATIEQNSLVAVGSCVFRPPYGEYDATTLSLARQRGIAVWTWSVDTEDWKAGTSTDPAWVERIVSRAVAGGSQAHPVVLMHNPPAGIPATVTALPRIIEYYRGHGFQFVTLLGRVGGASTPAAATTAGGVHLLVRTATGTVAERTLRGASWSGWTGLGGLVVNGPAASTLSPYTELSVAAAIATDNSVYRSSVTDPGTGAGWTALGGVASTRPGVATGPDGVQSVIVRGGDGRAYLDQWAGGRWTGWRSLGGALDPVAPAVTVSGDGVLVVGCVGTNHGFYVKTRSTAGAWSGWRLVGGGITSDLALSRTADGAGLVAAVRGPGTNAYVAVGTADGSTWSSWRNVGGGLGSGPAITVNGPALEMFVVGNDNRLYRNTATDGTAATGWTGWRLLP
jgi:peptidoglycan/xylan/chitin deacetylase (PgdA/CDA1 family)